MPVRGGNHEELRLECPALIWPQELTGQHWDGGCEPWNQRVFAARASRLTARLKELSTGSDVIALVTHHDFAQFLIADLLGVPDLNAEALRFELNNAATSLIELGTNSSGNEFRTLHWLNRSSPLD